LCGINPKEIVIDTGSLLVILAGYYGHNTITKFGYTNDDITLLGEFLKTVTKIFYCAPCLGRGIKFGKY